jgi:hypothetical protein
MAPAPLSSAGIGIANLPNQRHKIVAKRGANFTLMVVGKYRRIPEVQAFHLERRARKSVSHRDPHRFHRDYQY